MTVLSFACVYKLCEGFKLLYLSNGSFLYPHVLHHFSYSSG